MERGCKIMGTSIKTGLERHKMKPSEFTSFAAGVAKRLTENIRQRKTYRITVHDERRNFSSPSPMPSPEPKMLSELELKTQSRRAQLQKWKTEKEKQRKATAGQKKKPFLAGVYHAPMKFEFPAPVKPFQITMSRVTRSQTAAKARFIFDSKPTETKSKKPPTIKEKESVTKITEISNKKPKPVKSVSQTNLNTKKVDNKKTKEVSEKKTKVLPEKTTKEQKTKIVEKKPKDVIIKKPEVKKPVEAKNKGKKVPTKPVSAESVTKTVSIKLTRASITKPNSDSVSKGQTMNDETPLKVPRSESQVEDWLRSPQSPELEVHLEANHISPHITMSRGKENVRKENKQKIKDGLLAEDSSDGQTVQHYRRQLATEIARMTEMCNQWDGIMQKHALAESVQEQILAAVGLGRLLMGQKLQQFSGLVERCAHPDPDSPLVTATDLRGFWDLVFIQIEDVDLKFKKLEDLRQRNWEELTPVEKPVVKKMVPKKTVKCTAPSRIRDMIAAARKAQKEQTNNLQTNESNKTFEAGFFMVQSPVRSPGVTPAVTPKPKYSLLKEVMSSEAKKASANKSSYAMMRASLISKGTELEGIAPLQFTPLKSLPAIDLDATPARSILKSSKKSARKSKKSIKSVLFNDDEEIPEGVSSKPDPITTDSGLSSMELEDKIQKENKQPKKTKKLHRQDATEEVEQSKSLRKLRSRKSLDEKCLVGGKLEEGVSKLEKSTRKKKSLGEVNTESPKPLRRSRRHSVKL